MLFYRRNATGLLRCLHNSRRLEDFWKYRLNDHAARNDALLLAA